jgi:hypothetical protein
VSLVAILDEMQAVIEDTYDSGDLDVQVSRRFILNPTPPVIDLYPGDPGRDQFSQAFDDIDGGYLITVRTRIATGDYDAAYDWLLETMDDSSDLSLMAALDGEDLNGYAASIGFQNPSGLRAYEDVHGQGAYLGWQFTALVLAALS